MSKQDAPHSIREVEQALIHAKSGDENAEAALIQMFEPLLKSRCRHYFGYCDEDLIQLGSIRMLELIRAFDPTLCDNKFTGYVNRMISCYYWNLKKSEIRKAKEMQPTDYSEVPIQLLSYQENGFEQIEIRELLATLEHEQRCIILQNILYGKTIEQVAKALGIASERVKYQKRKALAKLRESIGIR